MRACLLVTIESQPVTAQNCFGVVGPLCGQVGYVASSQSVPRIPAFSPSGMPPHSFLADWNGPGVGGTRVTGTTDLGPGADGKIRASSEAKLGVDGRVSGHLVEGGRRVESRPSGSGTRSLMGRSAGAAGPGTG